MAPSTPRLALTREGFTERRPTTSEEPTSWRWTLLKGGTKTICLRMKRTQGRRLLAPEHSARPIGDEAMRMRLRYALEHVERSMRSFSYRVRYSALHPRAPLPRHGAAPGGAAGRGRRGVGRRRGSAARRCRVPGRGRCRRRRAAGPAAAAGPGRARGVRPGAAAAVGASGCARTKRGARCKAHAPRRMARCLARRRRQWRWCSRARHRRRTRPL